LTPLAKLSSTREIKLATAPKKNREFDPSTFLATIGDGRKSLTVSRKQGVFTQGDAADAVFYIQKGKVRLSVVSKTGKEATIGILGDGNFFGEGSLAGQALRMGSAVAMTDCSLLRIDKKAMIDALHREHSFSDMFVAYLLARNIRYEEDLVDQLFNQRKKTGPSSPDAGSFWQGRGPGNRRPKDQPGNPCGNGGNHSFAGELLHEPIQEVGIHSLRRRGRRRTTGSQFSAEYCAARLSFRILPFTIQ